VQQNFSTPLNHSLDTVHCPQAIVCRRRERRPFARRLQFFRPFSSSFLAVLGRQLTAWETLFIGRHHGLPVRLLDWTSNPLVAMYWSCASLANPASDAHTDGAIWTVARWPKEEHDIRMFDDRFSNPLAINGVKLAYPLDVSPRIVAQSARFTIHGKPALPLDEQQRRSSHTPDFDFSWSVKWIIPHKSKGPAITTLERIGVNLRTLYPDLEGLALGLWQTEILRSRHKMWEESTADLPAVSVA